MIKTKSFQAKLMPTVIPTVVLGLPAVGIAASFF